MFKLFLIGLASADMPTKTLNNGMEIPVVSMGTAGSNFTKVHDELLLAFKNGVFHIDTAHDYCVDGTAGVCPNGSNQIAIAKAVQDSKIDREKLFITTKVPGCGRYDIGNDTCAEDTLSVAQKNLDELQMDYVDLLLVHQPDQVGNCEHIQTQWKTLSSLVKQKKARAIGVSNYCKSSFQCLMNANTTDDFIVPVLNQIQYHVGMGPDPDGIISYSTSHGIVTQAYDPMGMRYHNNTELINGTLVTEIGQSHNKAPPSVGLKWIWQNDVILSTQTEKEEHLLQNIDIFDWQLSDDEMETLNQATKPEGVPSYMCSDQKEEKYEKFIQ